MTKKWTSGLLGKSTDMYFFFSLALKKLTITEEIKEEKIGFIGNR